MVIDSGRQRDDIFIFEEMLRHRYTTLVAHRRLFAVGLLLLALLCFASLFHAWTSGSLLSTICASLLLYIGYEFASTGGLHAHVLQPGSFLRRCNDALSRFHVGFDARSRRLVEVPSS
jgi:hydrogenase/urease accessory protein HupE